MVKKIELAVVLPGTASSVFAAVYQEPSPTQIYHRIVNKVGLAMLCVLAMRTVCLDLPRTHSKVACMHRRPMSLLLALHLDTCRTRRPRSRHGTMARALSTSHSPWRPQPSSRTSWGAQK
jgi:hypothetical protein